MYTETTEEDKKTAKIGVIIVIILLITFIMGAFNCPAQIGCSKQDIKSADTLFTELTEYKDCIIGKSDSNTITTFNFEGNYCTSVTIFCEKTKGNSYIRLLFAFEDCNKEAYSSSITYYKENLLIFKLRKQ